MTDNTFLQRDANGRLFRVEVFGPGRRVKVTDIMSPTGCFWWEHPETLGITFVRHDTANVMAKGSGGIE